MFRGPRARTTYRLRPPARSLVGNEVICTDDEDLRARLENLTAGKGVEGAIDCVAGELVAEIARNLAPAGTMLVYGALSSPADGLREIHNVAVRSAFDLFDSYRLRMVASAMGAFPAARRDAGSYEGSAHHVVQRSTYADSNCAVSI